MVDNGAYDEYTDNLQGYWRMGDGTLDTYPLIADQVDPTLGSDLAVWSGETVNVGAYSGIENNTTVNLTSGKLYKISFTVSSYTSGSFRFRQPSGADAGVTGSGNGDYTKYIVATNVNELNCDAFNLGFVGVISDYIVKEVQGNAGLMTNMVAGDIMIDAPNYDALVNTYSLDFDGSNDYVSIPDMTTGLTSITLGAWTKKSVDSTGAIMGYSAGGAYFRYVGAAQVYVYIKTDGTDDILAVGGASSFSNDGGWHHIVATVDSATQTIKIYEDGVVKKTVTNLSFGVFNGGQFTRIGDYSDANYFNGNIDEVSIWDKALSDDEVAEIYNNGMPIELGKDIGNYQSSSNLIGWYRMGDGDTLKLIENQANLPAISLGTDIWNDDYNTFPLNGATSGTATILGDEIVFDDFEGYFLGADTGTKVIGKVYKYQFEVTEVSVGTPASIHSEETGIYHGVGVHTKYITATTNVLRFYHHNFTGKMKRAVTVQEYVGNGGTMINMAVNDMEEDTP